jgi:hypothetical protein
MWIETESFLIIFQIRKKEGDQISAIAPHRCTVTLVTITMISIFPLGELLG